MNKFTLILLCGVSGFLGGKITESRANDLDLLFPVLLEKLDIKDFKYSRTEGYAIAKRASNGIWWQDGFTYQQNLTSSAVNKALTKDIKPWLKLEVNYLSMGKASGYTEYVSDENYSNNPSDPCKAPCEAIRSAVWEGTSKGLGVSVLPTYKTVNSVFSLRLGALYHKTTTVITAKNFHDNFVFDPNPSIGIYSEFNRGFSAYYGAQFNTKNILDKKDSLNFQYIHAPDQDAGMYGFQAGYKFISLTYKLEL